MSFYLDTSILVPLHIEEPQTARLDDWIMRVRQPMFIGDLAVAEFGSAISRLVRMKQLTPEEAGDKLSDFDRWRFEVARPVEVIPSDVRVAGQFVRKPMPRLMTADAIHLATCQRLGLTLVAHDTDLIDIARLNGIDVIQPE